METERDYSSEIGWWAENLPVGMRDPWMKNVINPDTRKIEFPAELLDYIEKMDSSEPLKVLDVGAGPLSVLAWGVEQNLFELVAIDPLADEYAKLLKQNNINYPVSPIPGVGEKVAEMFDEESFDIVYSRNALDHTVSPALCIENIVKVLKTGGIFFQGGLTKEGTVSEWTGLHQHDLYPENGNLMRANQQGEVTNLTEGRNLECILEEQTQYYDRDWYNIVFRKTAEIAIRVENLTKTYKLYDSPGDRVRETFHPFRKKYHHPFNALSNVSFDVKKGETIGVVGRNGSGKSTLLQLICGVLHPTSGSVAVNGRISALLELGTGFNPEFSGRENVYINGAILGLSKDEIDARFDQIARFADIGEFIEQPVKTYSSGMVVRLAFAVAVNVDPDILVVDEALSVGDIFFQHKCMTRMRKLMEKGATVIFVSHDMGAVKSLCGDALLFRDGKLVRKGRAEDVANEYFHQMLAEDQGSDSDKDSDTNGNFGAVSKTIAMRDGNVFKKNPEFLSRTADFRTGTGDVRIQNAELLDANGMRIEHCEFKQWLTVRFHLEFFIDSDQPNLGFFVRDKNGVEIIGTNLFQEDLLMGPKSKGDTVVVDFKFENILQNGTYSVTGAVCKSDDLGRYAIDLWDLVDNAIVFSTESQDGKSIHTKVSIPFDVSCYQSGNAGRKIKKGVGNARHNHAVG